MARFTIYDKDGNVRHESITGYTGDGQQVYADSLEYNGSWMGECFLTVSVKSAYPIDFHTGDYIDYRGERFTLNYDPGVVKKSRRGTYGEGFTYDSIKFTARHTELSEIRFLDYVLDDNHLHYTSLPEFPFYAASIDDYCDRLQANTNRWCKSNGLAVEDYWLFLTPSTNQQGYPEKTVQRAVSYGLSAAVAHQRWLDAYGQGTYIDEEKRDVSVSVSQQSVWDSLSLIKSDFGLNFITRGRQVIIGAAGLPTSHLFKYGKDNGLYEIERIADTEQAVITKMYAYGSESNMPTRYYANLNTECSATFTGGLVMNASLDYGYKGNVWMTSVPWKPSVYTNRQNTDAFVRIEFISGNLEGERTMALATPIPRSSEDAAEQGVAQMTGIFLLQELGKNPSAGSVVKILSGVDKDKWDTAHRITPENLPNNMAVNRLMLPGFPKKSLYDWVIANGGTAESDAANDDNIGKATWRGYTAFFSKDKYQPYILSVNFKELGIREATEMFDGTDDNEDIYPTIEGTGYDEIYAAETIRDNGVFAEGENEPTVTITLPSFGDGFYLRELVETGDSPKIVMRNGYCGSREFEIQSVREVSGRWECKCKREYDDLLDIWFPYSYAVSQGGTAKADEPYQVCAGDKYVLTGIAMTDTYIEASAVRLLEASLLLLSKNDYTRYTYLPKVDEIYMARQHESHEENNERSLYETVKEGDIMLFKDDDLGIDGSVFIDTLRIKENGNNGIPTYDVTLRNDKQVGTLQRIQNKIDSLSSLVNAGGGGLSVAQIRELISTYGGGLFLSKLNADTARGVITFLQGLVSEAYTKFGVGADFGDFLTGYLGYGARIGSQGDIEATSLVLRSYLEVPKLVYNHVDVRVGDEWQTNGAGEIESVAVDTDDDGNELNTGTITLRLLDGEYGTLRLGDRCKGIFHHIDGYNDTETGDDGKGGRTFAGFYTSYFVITGVSGAQNETLRYELRPTIEVGGNTYWQSDEGRTSGIRGGFHPSAHMVFAQYSNSEDETRQNCQYRTTTYTRMLTGMTGWDERLENVAFQIGNTPLIASAYNVPDAGKYTMWINGDIYFSGTLNRIDSWGRGVTEHPDQGNYNHATQYHLNDLSHYDGAVWMMAIESEETVGVAPGTSVTIDGTEVYPWVKWIWADSMAPEGQWSHTKTPYAANSIVNIEGMLLISKRSTSQPPVNLLTDEKGEPLQTETGEYIAETDDISGDWILLFDIGDITNGEDGQNAIAVNLTNDTDSVLTDEQGNITGTLPTTTAQLYDGATLVTGGVEWSVAAVVGCEASVDASTGFVTVTAMTADEARVVVQASYNTRQYTKIFTFKKLYGKDKLWIECDVDKVTRNPDTGDYTPEAVTVRGYIQSGASGAKTELTQAAGRGYLRCGTDSTNRYSPYTLTLSDSVFSGNHLAVMLYDKDGVLQDVEDIVRLQEATQIKNYGDWSHTVAFFPKDSIVRFGGCLFYSTKEIGQNQPPYECITDEKGEPLQTETGEYIVYNDKSVINGWVLWAMDGKSGTDAVTHTMTVTPDSFALNAEGKYKSDPTVEVQVWRHEGDTETLLTSLGSMSLRLYVSGNEYQPTANGGTFRFTMPADISPSSVAEVRLYSGNDILLRTTVSIVQDGSQGFQGCSTRVSEWSGTAEYRNDEGKNLALGYIDVVAREDASMQDGYRFYQLIAGSYSGETYKSSTPPESDTSHWTELSNVGPIYTSMLIAKNAYIKFGTGNEFRITNASGVIQAGMRGGTETSGGIRIWAGNIYNGGSIDLNLAPFRVTQEGTLYASDVHIKGEITATSGSFTGTITATGGKITGTINVTSGGQLIVGDTNKARFVMSASGNGGSLNGLDANGNTVFGFSFSASDSYGTQAQITIADSQIGAERGTFVHRSGQYQSLLHYINWHDTSQISFYGTDAMGKTGTHGTVELDIGVMDGNALLRCYKQTSSGYVQGFPVFQNDYRAGLGGISIGGIYLKSVIESDSTHESVVKYYLTVRVGDNMY